ncbi:MAG: tRNA (adenosine(37)-N6)-threonylcarbamoyltransferase complex dimerization subunit type 1 TsaB, partial [Alcanivoracaceae bacterium]|nr:tRNA (adenosine(37)-N6)-threonylcarbamoyltransferase complex dimerization subunit type 1 TsaB [Alcanivoracaceae bacterium]
RRQTERVLPMVDELLAAAGVTLASLDAIAFSQGPGAFTGVRVAVSIAQGLGFAADVPLLGVSTLACTAQAAALAHGAGHWLVAQDARMGELYVGQYRLVEGEQVVQACAADVLLSPEALADLPAGNWRGVGSGALYLDTLRARWPSLGDWFDDIGPRAGAMLPLAQAALQRGEVVAAEQARPVYLRNQVIQGAIR